jgi:type VI protein secretion system component VasF
MRLRSIEEEYQRLEELKARQEAEIERVRGRLQKEVWLREESEKERERGRRRTMISLGVAAFIVTVSAGMGWYAFELAREEVKAEAEMDTLLISLRIRRGEPQFQRQGSRSCSRL